MTTSNPGNEWFIREDAERKRKLALEVERTMQAAERQRLKDLHWMHCPKCGMQMQEMKLRGVDVDVCFGCNGIFLDKGDLEHLDKPETRGVMGSFLNWFKAEKGT